MAGTGLTRIGPYPLLSRLGAGGMGTVYLALHRGLGGFEKRLAVKCLNPHVAEDQQFVAMLVDEARLTAQLSHPNIVQVIDLSSSDGLHYLVMEYVEGIDARTLASAGPLALDEAAHIIADAARGLAYAHRKTGPDGNPLHIVHRDISGHNLLVSTAGATKVLDFGIAKAASNRHTTEIGVLKGKLAYMSPEQAMGKALDGRSDLFSLGIVLWELCTGRRLFTGDTDMQLLMKVQRCEIERPSLFSADFPAALETILMRCLAPVPDDRYADGDALADDLLAFARGCAANEPAAKRIGNKVAAYLRAHPPVPLSDVGGETTVVAKTPAAGARRAAPPERGQAGAQPRAWMVAGIAIVGLAGIFVVGGMLWLRTREGGAAVSREPAPRAPRPAAVVIAEPAPAPPPKADEVTAPSTQPPEGVAVSKSEKRPTDLRLGSPLRETTGGERPATQPAAPADPRLGPTTGGEPAAPADGYLSINAVPWARVYVDGKPAAESTPLLRFALAPGRHKVVLVNPELRVRREIEVEVVAGEERRERVQMGDPALR